MSESGTERRIAAAIDLGFARDSSALAVVDEVSVSGQELFRLRALEEVRGGDASDPTIVVASFIGTLRKHGVTQVMSDCHYRALLRVALAEVEIELLPEPAGAMGKTAVYLYARRVLPRLRLPPHPLRARLVGQLKDTRGKPLSGGAMEITHTRKDGGHGDLASALVLALWQLRPSDGDYRHMSIRARGAELDPRSRVQVEPCLAGIERGVFEDYAPVD